MQIDQRRTTPFHTSHSLSHLFSHSLSLLLSLAHLFTPTSPPPPSHPPSVENSTCSVPPSPSLVPPPLSSPSHTHSREFYMLCDNEQVRTFTLRAACRQIDVTVTEVNTTPYNQHIEHLRQDMYFHSVVITTEQTQVHQTSTQQTSIIKHLPSKHLSSNIYPANIYHQTSTQQTSIITHLP